MRRYWVFMMVILVALSIQPVAGCRGKAVSKRVAALQEKARALSEEAVAFQKEGRGNAARTRYQEAVNVYLDILNLAPNSYEARLNLGILYNYFGDYDKAEESLNKARVLNEENGRAYFYLGSMYLNKGDPHQAELWFEISIEKEPAYAPAYFFLGRTKYDLGTFFDAKTNLEKYVQLAPSGDYVAKAQEYLALIPKNIQPPVDVNILPAPPDASTTPATPANVSTQPGTTSPATPATQGTQPKQDTGSSTQPEKPKDTSKTEKPKETKEPEKPKETKKPAETKPPEKKPAPKPTPKPEEPTPKTYAEWIEAGRSAMATKDYKTAISDFEQAYTLEPSFSEVNMLLGKAYRGTKQYDSALQHLNKALKQDPDNSDSLLETAYCYEGKKDIPKAIDYFEKFLAIKDRKDIREHVEELRKG